MALGERRRRERERERGGGGRGGGRERRKPTISARIKSEEEEGGRMYRLNGELRGSGTRE